MAFNFKFGSKENMQGSNDENRNVSFTEEESFSPEELDAVTAIPNRYVEEYKRMQEEENKRSGRSR